ncbi:MAG: DUF4445 domain-containing protein [Magnetococcales bacterium]|nr:DUF4445 domain-containing protein [Magnetococcales bacterium]
MVTIRCGDTLLRLALIQGASVRELLDTTHLRVRASCGGNGSCGACCILLIHGACNPPTRSEWEKLTPAQRAEGYRLACQLRPAGPCELQLIQPAAPSPWKSIPPPELHHPPNTPPTPSPYPLGVAVDLGTTHLRITLWDRTAKRRIASRWGINPQEIHGADILNRLTEANRTPQRAAELAQLPREAILHAVRDMLARDLGEVTPMLKKIGQVMIVGNTAMLTLLAGTNTTPLLDPNAEHLPIHCQPDDPAAWQRHWEWPNAQITLLPPVSPFIGSDLLAGVVASQLPKGPPGSLLLDLGTNIELALWDGQTLYITSTPGGPAFEVSGVRHGMNAETGAIHRITRQHDTLTCHVTNGESPKGFCGSGLLDAIAVLRQQAILKPSGRFASPCSPNGYPLLPDYPHITVTPKDVDTFQRAKAACAAAMSILLQQARMTWSDLNHLWICGAFGNGINGLHAQQLGLIPPLNPEKLHSLPGAALQGCEMALLSPNGAQLFQQWLPVIHPVNLSTSTRFEEEFIQHLHLRAIGDIMPINN